MFNIFLNKKRDGLSRDQAIIKLHKKNWCWNSLQTILEHSIYRKIYKWKINKFPNAKKIGRETISLPLSPSLTNKEILKVINSIKEIVTEA